MHIYLVVLPNVGVRCLRAHPREFPDARARAALRAPWPYQNESDGHVQMDDN